MSNIYDKFYTADAVVKDCISSWENCIEVGDDEYVVECSAGAGAFLNHLSSYKVKAYDIKPEADGIVQQDFLSLDENKEYGNHNVHYLSNVPFGKGSSLANKFIKKCTNDHRTKSFSFVLPASHSRSYLMNKVNKYFHIVHQHFCSDFVEYGKSQKINCVFQVWVRKSYPRELIDRKPLSSLITITNKENANFKIGNKARTARVFKIDTDTKQKTISSSSFIYVRVNDETLAKYFIKYEGMRIHKVRREQFIACANSSREEIINGTEKIMKKIHRLNRLKKRRLVIV